MSEPSDQRTDQPPQVIGIAGGGQLAQMMIESARGLGLEFVVLDPNEACSSSEIADRMIVADFDSIEDIVMLGQSCDVLTFEIERINTEGLLAVEQAGTAVRPSAQVLQVIQDKLQQKRFLTQHNIPTSEFFALHSSSELIERLPQVWKARRDGYDGRGVQMVRSAADIDRLPDVPAMAEALVDIDYELAIMVARGMDGAIRHYPLTEIEMDPDAHVMQRVIAPAQVSSDIESTCQALATQVADALQYVGVLALEFFVDRHGQVYVNELSPRPHNSGHYSIEACITSQFEQHVRAVAGLPLGSTELQSAAVCFNVLGDLQALGTPRYVGFERQEKDVFVHNYHKPEVRPGRKMAHVTVLGGSRDDAIALADAIQPEIRVLSE